MRRPRTLALAVAGLALGVAIGATGCGPDEDGTALAVERVRWRDADHVLVGFECADVHWTELQTPTPGNLTPMFTAWGRPRTGRCSPEVLVTIDPAVTGITDAASGMVVDLPPRPPSTDPAADS